MKKSILLFTFLLTILSSCRKDEVNDNSESCYTNTSAQSIVHNGVNREYVLYIPNSYDGTSSVPLMLNFHGFGGSASDYMQEADMRSLAEADTFILIYPQGSCLDGLSHWNACPLGGDNKSDADDFGFVEAIINEISSQYNVDMERIYAAGYSNGGMMAYGLANYKSNLVAAVASVSGVMLECTGSTSHPMPVVHLHGTSDGVLPYNGSSDWNSAQSTLDYWINFNNTITTPTVSIDNSGGMSIEHYVYDQGDSSVSVEHYKFIGGDHVWFSATYQDQNTSELVWNFVSRYDINGLR
ncbi:prolyl oligopeptidase family serine peptidase [Flavobacteriaceae bacterium]|jgi:polyhydroxybutyrate depolymerase|nr:prolyl oligopeptidase family serine peptidase [Flavobacteriaceae bacterium]MDB4226500.1 prolyl oligopeptidase family serine peptidase [Flavobacteriaceae bacterium]MDB9893521.1 prolyl oligopeptidase family serine peptidase [Flavobacteriaceae bacterium]MDC1343957.1 prolyl oligopeptidase family serine peptidase [Flavobacteriaceae bacterium]